MILGINAEQTQIAAPQMVLPVKVSIDKVTHLAHTIDITHAGARLGALRMPLRAGISDGQGEAKNDVQELMTMLSNCSKPAI